MSIEEQQNNPLLGVGAEAMVTAIVDHYGWDILYAALGLKCFQINPSVSSCVTFLKKTEWAKMKVESFYLYRFKQMPKADRYDLELPPRERGFASGILPGEPMALTFGMIATMKEAAEEAYQAKQASRRSRSRE